MARFAQSVQLETPRGARPSGDHVRATDFGLGEVGEDLKHVAKVRQAVEDEKDGYAAETLLEQVKQTYQPEQARRAEEYDGSQPGYAVAELSHLNDAALPVLDGASEGVRVAFGKLYDDYRGKLGDHVVNVEAAKRAEPLRLQRLAQESSQVTGLTTDLLTAYGEKSKTRLDAYDGSQSGYAAGATADFDEEASRVLALASPELKPQLQIKLNDLRLKVATGAQVAEQKAMGAFVSRNVKAQGDSLVNGVLSNPAMYETNLAALSDIAGPLPADLRAGYRQEMGQALAEARLKGMVLAGNQSAALAELDAGKWDKALTPSQKLELITYSKRAEAAALRGTGAAAGNYDGDPSVAPGKAAGIEWVWRDLEGGDAVVENDGGKGVTRGGVNQTAHPELDVRNLTVPQQHKALGKYWDDMGAGKLPPAMALTVTQAAINIGVAPAKAMLDQSAGDPMRFLDLQEAHYAKLLADNPAKWSKYRDSWAQRVGKTREQVERLQGFAATRDGFASDPLSYAVGNKTRAALINVPSLPVADALSGDAAAQAAFAQGLAARVGAGQVLARDYPGVPARMLMNSERTILADQLKANPELAPKLAAVAVNAIGIKGAQALMTELGLDGRVAPAVLHVAGLAANSSTGSTAFTDSAGQGFALRAQGATDKTAKLDTAFAPYRSALSRQPEVLIAAKTAAEAAMLADHAKGVEHPESYYVRSALGSITRNGRIYGGPATVNGAMTVLPPWLAPEYADDALEALAGSWAAQSNGPRYDNGKPMSAADVRRAQLILQPDGRYVLADKRNPNNVARDSKGGVLFLDFDRMRPFLSAKLGERGVAR